MKKILIAVSDNALRTVMTMFLTSHEWQCVEATNTVDAVRYLGTEDIKLVIVGRSLEPQGYEEAVQASLRLLYRRPVIVVSGGANLSEIREIAASGAHYFQTGGNPLQLPATLRKLYFLAYEDPTMLTVWQVIGRAAEAVYGAPDKEVAAINDEFKNLTTVVFRAIASERNISLETVHSQLLTSRLSEMSKSALAELLYWVELHQA